MALFVIVILPFFKPIPSCDTTLGENRRGKTKKLAIYLKKIDFLLLFSTMYS